MASALMRPAFPFYRTHRPNSFLWETVGWFKRLNLRQAERGKSREQWSAVCDRPYFALPLQLDSDYQIRVHSPFGTMRARSEEHTSALQSLMRISYGGYV